jgi:hypothetical protein
MKILVDFPAPPEYLLPGAWGIIHSRCSFLVQLLDAVTCALLSLRNPYFDFSMRRHAPRRLRALCSQEGVLDVRTTHLPEARLYESRYRLPGVERVVVTEVRGSFFHGRYFHTQRVLAMIARDLARVQHGGRE